MKACMMEQLAPEAFYAVAEELGLDSDLLMDAEVVFVEEAKADLARTHADPERIEPVERVESVDDAEAFMQEWARNLMIKVLCRLETRPHDQFRALTV